jgi:hypothetical protein
VTPDTGLRRFARPRAGAAASQPGNQEGTTFTAAGDAGTALPEAAATLPEALAARLSAGSGAAAAAERCEMCAAGLPADHGHVADLEAGSLICACRACSLLFTRDSAARGRYRAVPDRYLSDVALTPAEWDELQVPVGLAFFLRSSATGELAAFYPSPAGATQCQLDLAAWQRLEVGHPLLTAAAPDVEAVLIAAGDASADLFVVPVDVCYELTGRMRMLWRGFDGGSEARESIAQLLDRVRSRAMRYVAEAGRG